MRGVQFPLVQPACFYSDIACRHKMIILEVTELVSPVVLKKYEKDATRKKTARKYFTKLSEANL